jgi:hypothetical protein
MAGNICRSLVLSAVISVCSSPSPKLRNPQRASFGCACIILTPLSESIVVYRRGGAYVSEALSSLDNFLRDYRTGEVSSL